MATVREVAVAGIENEVTAGAAMSGSVMVTLLLRAADTLPAASLVQAYAVRAPSAEKVNEEGATALQPGIFAAGAEALSVTRYPVTLKLSLAANEEMPTVSEFALAGMEKELIAGAAVSGSVIVTLLLRPADTLPAASLVQAYAVLFPSAEKVNVDGAAALQPDAVAAGAEALSVTR